MMQRNELYVYVGDGKFIHLIGNKMFPVRDISICCSLLSLECQALNIPHLHNFSSYLSIIPTVLLILAKVSLVQFCLALIDDIFFREDFSELTLITMRIRTKCVLNLPSRYHPSYGKWEF